jgi:hypothetical protein
MSPQQARSKVDEVLERAQVQHSDDPERVELIAKVRRFKASWFELGEALADLRKSGAWKKWGFPTFEDYCKRELHMRQDTVDKLTGSFSFLRSRAPDVLKRDGREAPIPSYQAVDFWRRAEEAEAPTEALREIRAHVLDEGTPLPKLSRMYRQVVFDVDEEDPEKKRRALLVKAAMRLMAEVENARKDGWVPEPVALGVEKALTKLNEAVGS